MAGLETVAAPPDFDFHLRARLAREKSATRNGHGFASLFSIPRPIAIAVLVLLLAVVGVVIKNRIQSDTTPPLQARQPAGVPVPRRDNPDDKKTISGEKSTVQNAITGTPDNTAPRQQIPKRNENSPRNFIAGSQKVRGTAVRDSAVSPAAVMIGNQLDGNVVLVPLDDQSLRISIDDRRRHAPLGLAANS